MRIEDIIFPVVIFGLAISGAACSSDPLHPENPDEYVIFGDFYGECAGEGCVDIFKIQDERAFEDTLDRYPVASELPHQTAFVEIEVSDYDQVAELLSNIPSDLFDEDAVVIGQPDAGDWGGFYLEVRLDNQVRYWLIDKMEDNLPPYLRPFARDLDEAIRLVQGQESLD